jgi:hypothetical protein
MKQVTKPPDLMVSRVLLKLVGVERPIPITVSNFGDRGIWARDKTLQENCYPSATVPPMSLGKSPWVFVPLSQIEWLMVPDRDDH